MTALAQCLVDAGKSVRGSDVAEDFVTKKVLDNCGAQLDIGFTSDIPEETECVVFTAAHKALENPQVQQALSRKLPTLTHAEALASLFNAKKGIAVCGVGGKSTTAAMIAWILEKTNREPSFAVGVGDIIGLNRTGRWRSESEFFVAEADEYVTDPSALKKGLPITPRFSFLRPYVTVCTNLVHDHPDVYPTFADTKRAFLSFFSQIVPGGWLIINGLDQSLAQVAREAFADRLDHLVTYGVSELSQNQNQQTDPTQSSSPIQNTPTVLSAVSSLNFFTTNISFSPGRTTAQLNNGLPLQLKLPGKYNISNALGAILALDSAGVSLTEATQSLAEFSSTTRRCQLIRDSQGVLYYDDYGHHPSEVQRVITAMREWYPDRRLVVAFQSHTFSRTRTFFAEFVDAFTAADEVVMIDIFASAREPFDSSITSTMLCQAIEQAHPQVRATNLGNLDKLAQFCRTSLRPQDIFLTVGAGDIYKVYDQLFPSNTSK